MTEYRRVLIHSPNISEPPDSMFWWDESNKLQYVVADERIEFMRALETLDRMSASPGDIVIDFLVGLWPNLVGMWDDMNVVVGQEQAVLTAIRNP